MLQAVGGFRMCTSLSTLIVFVGIPGQIRVMASSGAEGGVVMIQTLGAICMGILTSGFLLTCSEQCAEILVMFLEYKAEIHIGRFANG